MAHVESRGNIVHINNISNGQISHEQTHVMKQMKQSWVTDYLPQLARNSSAPSIFMETVFNSLGKQNTETIERLAAPGSQCESLSGDLNGYRVKFSDGFEMTILPLSMTYVESPPRGGDRYKIRYMAVDDQVHRDRGTPAITRCCSSNSPLLTAILEREIEIPSADSGQLTGRWHSPSGEISAFEATQRAQRVSMQELFRNEKKDLSLLCQAESDISRVHQPSASGRSGSGPQRAVQ